jgi:5-methylcytosine-specific restriction enzyme subunit McrC
MLCYAWDRLDEADALSVGVDGKTEILDLLASVLVNGLKRCLRDGIDKGYVDYQEELRGIRGRLALQESIQRISFIRGAAVCNVDNFTTDILSNQLIKSTIFRLTRVEGLDKAFRGELRDLIKRMQGVSILSQVQRRDFRRVPLHGNNRLYRFLLNVCELIFDSSLVEKGDGTYVFKNFVEDEYKMRSLFQRFVQNFLRHHQHIYQVSVDRFSWDFDIGLGQFNHLVPQMETDVTLKSSGKVIVIDTKYSKDTLQGRFDKKTLRSEHLYQLFSYLKNLEARGHPYDSAEGILLYPTVNSEVSASFSVQGHKIGVRTIDLTLPSEKLKDELIRVLIESDSEQLVPGPMSSIQAGPFEQIQVQGVH